MPSTGAAAASDHSVARWLTSNDTSVPAARATSIARSTAASGDAPSAAVIPVRCSTSAAAISSATASTSAGDSREAALPAR